VADGPEPGSWTGLAAMEAAFRERMSAWDDYRFRADEIRDLDGERVLALNRRSGRGRASGLDIGQMKSAGVNLFHLREGKVTNLLVYGTASAGLPTSVSLGGTIPRPPPRTSTSVQTPSQKSPVRLAARARPSPRNVCSPRGLGGAREEPTCQASAPVRRSVRRDGAHRDFGAR
jgi:hypothetical protein